MDNLFGVPLSSFLIALTLLVVLIGGILLWIWWRNPLLVRMGLRNVVRRKTQTALTRDRHDAGDAESSARRSPRATRSATR